MRALTNTNAPECTDLVHALLRTTIGLIDHAAYDHPTERRLQQVAASAAQCAGWLHFDQGEYPPPSGTGAQRCTPPTPPTPRTTATPVPAS